MIHSEIHPLLRKLEKIAWNPKSNNSMPMPRNRHFSIANPTKSQNFSKTKNQPKMKRHKD
jgi:hypothetical protein